MTSEVRISELLAPNQHEFHRDAKTHSYTHYWLAGGRGSTKSSSASIELWLTLLRNPDANAVVLRKVAKTLRKSVYAQVLWAAGVLGLSTRIKDTVSPMEITYLPTGQKIVFEGLDEPEKIKSMKFISGYPGVVWFEEIDQFCGMEEVRNVHQSLLRGGDRFWCFYSFNPPRSRDNWVNRHLTIERAGNCVYRSDYLEVPPSWLGEQFINEAEQLRELNELAYRHEYLGEATGTGGNVFENVTLRTITDEEIATFDRVYNGVDWGYFPDPWAFVRVHYRMAQSSLLIFDEASETRASNEATAAIVKKRLSDADGNVMRERVTCDSAEPKSVDNYRALGIDARGAQKGPGSVEHGMKWLSSRAEIVIDPKRCPRAAAEFIGCEYETNREGEYVSGYPDRDNHVIDATRYALERLMGRRSNV
jgi:PBSX family phage terminase large subunit